MLDLPVESVAGHGPGGMCRTLSRRADRWFGADRSVPACGDGRTSAAWRSTRV